MEPNTQPAENAGTADETKEELARNDDPQTNGSGASEGSGDAGVVHGQVTVEDMSIKDEANAGNGSEGDDTVAQG